MSTPVSPPTPKHVAQRQGLLFGGSVGVMSALILGLVSVFRFLFFSYGLDLVYLLALLAFFLAGWRAAKKTNRVDMGALAGLWAGVVLALVGIAIYTILLLISYNTYRYATSSLSSIVSFIISSVFVILRNTVLALLVGPTLGAVGGLLGRIDASGPNASSPSAQPSTPPTQTP